MADINISKLKLPNDNNTYHYKDTVSGYKSTDATQSEHGLLSTTDKIKLDGIASGAEVNQNAFSNVKVGSTTVAADSKTDTLELVGGANITLTPDATNDKITILLDDTVDTGEVIATDIQAGNLIVNGTSRFLNTINGTASNSEKLNGQSLTSTYSSTGTAPITGAAVASAIGTLDGTVSGSPSASKTLTAFSQTDGKVSATFGNISITKSQVSDFPTLGTAAAKNYTTSVSSGSADLVTSGAVWTAIDNLPEPMVFKGSVGAGGTVTDVPVDGTAKVGDTYKVITDGTYGGKTAKLGDTLICLTKTSSANTWELIPSGDEPSGTVTSVGVSNGGGLSVSGSPITSSGTITISHSDTSSQASVSNSGRTYIQSITLDTYGHVTKLTSATETVTNTDRYVNSAAFAHDSTNDNVKMTLTRAGSDTATVTANIPKVSSSSAGVVPKGATVSSQSQTTKFLREDGTWAAPSYTTDTNTTYSLSASGESVVLSGSDNSSSTANLSTAFANYTPYKGNLTSIIGSASPASAMKTYWENNDNIKPTSVNTAYNTAGQEYAFLLSKGGSNQYGAVIRWGYGTKYFEILRKYGSTWKDDDWVKMDAGYADSAGADSDGNAINTTYVKKNDNNKSYTSFKSFYQGGTVAGTYIRILIDSATTWTMMYMELSIRNAYNATGGSNGGRLIINGYHGTNATWQGLNAFAVGKLENLQMYSSDGKYLYIKNLGSYTTLSIDKMLMGDTISGTDMLNKISIDGVDELPETYATVPIYKTWSTYDTGSLGFNRSNSAITYKGTKATYDMVRFIDNTSDAYGNGIVIGGGGQTIVGGGESSTEMMNQAGTSGTEIMYIGNDTDVNIYTNLQNGWSSRKTFTFDTSGNLTATKFIGALQGNADTATTATTATNLSGFTNTTTSGTAIDSATQNGHVYVTGTSGIYSQNDGAAFVQAYSTSWVAQIYQDYRTGQIALRGKNNGTWQSWRKVWDSVNLKSETAAASGTTLSLVTTGEKATWNAKGSGTITSVKTTAGAHTTINVTSGAANFNVPTKTSHLTNDSGFVTQDTKNTAGSTDTSSKIFLIGATSQAANPQTYSQDTAYVGTDGCLYSGGVKVLTSHQDISGKVSKTGDTMTGCLSITSANASWAEGIRINRGNGGYCSFVMGGAANSTSGTGDNVWWLGCNPSSYSHKWFVAHNGSTQTGTYFYVDSASQQSPHFRVGGDLAVGSKTTMSKTCTLRYNDSTLSLDFIFTT